jgi:hypothetical protein
MSLILELVRRFPKAARRRTAHSCMRSTAFLIDKPLKAALRNIQNSKQKIKQKVNQKGGGGRDVHI